MAPLNAPARSRPSPRRRALLPVGVAAGAALVAALATGMSARSESALDFVRTAEAVAEASGGDYGTRGLAGVMSRLDGAQLSLALRHDPAMGMATVPGLTPGWESLRLGGKPDPFATVNGLEALRLNAAMAGDAVVNAAPPFAFRPSSADDRRRAMRCLTQAVYYEAALEADEGQAGVAQVVLNRVRDPNYPNSICGVVYQGAERNTGCQFTFTCDGSLSRAPVAWAWTRAQKVAEKALAGAVADKVGSATHYHADYVRPWWAPSLTKVSQSGAHIFYRWKGAAGMVASLTQGYGGREPLIDEARFARPRDLLALVEETSLADNSAELARQLLGTGNREVEFEGTTRIVGAPSLGGRRQPTAKEISDINDRLKAFEEGRTAEPRDAVAQN
ncbi:cell wall hydrolase [Brevundimonas terrae]|uniref:cell wall hydrolase n=1 Tax=Brevundimonas terrae TaxID=363631 RepID=UPI0014224CF2|nr:cell wall hydrolase [Brevundimonas terrae]NIJ25494.1 spore germination cell wall hydrolase CwlJ-like protein [Brevundimonas terrae]